MGTDFFDGLVKTFSKTTKELGKTTRELGARAEQTIEAQKIRSKITGEERIIEKIKVDIGDIVYRRHSQGDGIDSELSALCQEIDQHYLKIREYKDNAANLKGEKICPSCEREVDINVSFCPYCGTPCPTKMPVLSDFTESSADYSWGISDGSEADDSDGEDSSSYGYDYSGSDGGTVTADTSALESALETASDELAELQSDLASEKAIAEADSTSLTKEEKEKLKVTDNLSELDAKSAEELVKEGKKGITAEFNGIISKADIKQGAAVTQGMELFTIENADKASVDVTLSKYDYNTVKEGQSVEITLGDNTYQGTVTKMSHIAVQNEKGTPVISATVSIDNPDEDIFLGVDAKVKIYAASAKNVVTLPVEVVNIGKEGSFCYVIEDGLVTKRNITTGISSEDYVEITDGIKEGEEVIADLGDYTEGMEVQAVPEQTGEDADE